MRNYISLLVISWIQNAYSEPGHVLVDSQPAYGAGSDDADLQDIIVSMNDAFEESIVADSFDYSYPYPAAQQFLTFDKSNVMRIFQGSDRLGTINAQYLWQNVPDHPTSLEPADQIFPAVMESPRKTGWTDESGVKRSAPPSESGSKRSGGGLKLVEVSLLVYLSQIYAVLVQLPNPVPALKKIIADLLALIRRVSQGLATQAEIDHVLSELHGIGASV